MAFRRDFPALERGDRVCSSSIDVQHKRNTNSSRYAMGEDERLCEDSVPHNMSEGGRSPSRPHVPPREQGDRTMTLSKEAVKAACDAFSNCGAGTREEEWMLAALTAAAPFLRESAGEECAKEINACDAGSDCEDNLGMDITTGAGECRRENRGEECVCGAINDALLKATRRIRALTSRPESKEADHDAHMDCYQYGIVPANKVPAS